MLFENPVCCKVSKQMKGVPFGDKKKTFRKVSRTVPKKFKGGPIVSSGFVSYVKNGINERGDPLH